MDKRENSFTVRVAGSVTLTAKQMAFLLVLVVLGLLTLYPH